MQFEYTVPQEQQGADRTAALVMQIFPGAVRRSGMNTFRLPNGETVVATWRRIVHNARGNTSPLQALIA